MTSVRYLVMTVPENVVYRPVTRKTDNDIRQIVWDRISLKTNTFLFPSDVKLELVKLKQ